MPSHDAGPLDTDTIGALREDRSLLREIRDLFVTEAPDQLDAMVQACANRDTKLLAQAAHRLKGTAVTFGANGMRQLCLEIEQLGLAGSLHEVEALIERLRAECDRVRHALDEALTDR
ncbi:MAG: Hpt domain-containing protein [Candidatus Binataceae bacterium]